MIVGIAGNITTAPPRDNKKLFSDSPGAASRTATFDEEKKVVWQNPEEKERREKISQVATKALENSKVKENVDYRSASDKKLEGLAGDTNNFLKLTLATLSNQDPTDPEKTHELAQTLASLSHAEETVKTNKHLEKLVALNEDNGILSAHNVLGRNVSYQNLDSSLVDGHAEFIFKLEPEDDEEINAVHVKVRDESGTYVYEEDLQKFNKGENLFRWNGVDLRGKKANSGKYSLDVFATDKKGNRIPVKNELLTGTVNAVIENQNKMILDVGGKRVPAQDIIKIEQANITSNEDNLKEKATKQIEQMTNNGKLRGSYQ